jgi:hypothetical protein
LSWKSRLHFAGQLVSSEPRSPQIIANSTGAKCEQEEEEHVASQEELTDAKATADLVLNDLVRMATAIRTGATSSRQQKADNSFDADDDDERDLRSHLQLIATTHASTLESQRERFWSTTATKLRSDIATEQRTRVWSQTSGSGALDMSMRLTVIQERLVIANLMRHHRFVYSQTHGRKIPLPSVAPSMLHATWEDITQPPELTPDGATAEAAVGSTQTAQPPRKTQNPNITTELTDTTATDIGSKVYVELAKKATPSQQALTVMSTTGLKLRYPHPPKLKEEAQVFKCPCCSITLPVSYAEKQRWRSVRPMSRTKHHS